jgi:hypothetical protein
VGEALAEARKALRCLYIAVDESVARDVEAKAEAAFAALRPRPASGTPDIEGKTWLVCGCDDDDCEGCLTLTVKRGLSAPALRSPEPAAEPDGAEDGQ